MKAATGRARPDHRRAYQGERGRGKARQPARADRPIPSSASEAHACPPVWRAQPAPDEEKQPAAVTREMARGHAPTLSGRSGERTPAQSRGTPVKGSHNERV